MRIDSITLKNFRCFDKLSIDFDEKLTVIVAVNGAGKTTILDAVRIALWPYASSFDLANNGFNDPANTITIDDITKATIDEHTEARLLPTHITACGNILGIDKWKRLREKESPRSKVSEDQKVKEIRQYARNIQECIRTDESSSITLPVLGYYGTGRLWSNKKEKKKSPTQTEIYNSLIRTYGYMDCLDPASSYRAFEKWFIKTLNGHTAEIGKIIKKEGKLSLDYKTKFSDRIVVIQNALDTVLANTDYREIDLDIESQKLSMHNHKLGIDLKVEQLSDGVRNMIGMVADIAYRCYQLNPHLGERAALEAKGIVMIDEVDMHLHPQWQQLIIGQLMQAFPSIQFILTTHSPQVITTVPAHCIRGLKLVDGHLVLKKYDFSEGAEAQDVLEEIFEVSSRPRNLDIVQKLIEYQNLVTEDKWDTERAEVLRKDLNKWGGGKDPILLQLDMDIRMRQYRRSKSQ